MKTPTNTFKLLLGQKKFQDAYILARRRIEEAPNELSTLLVLAVVSQSPLEKAHWAFKARQTAPQNPQAQKAWKTLPLVPMALLVAQAGQVNWSIRRINRPIAEAVAAGEVVLKDLSWASYNMHRNRLLRWAAAIYGAHLQNKLQHSIRAAEAFATLWPFQQIHLPIEQALRENKIDFGDLCYAIMNGREGLPTAAALASALLIFEQLPKPSSRPQPAAQVSTPPQIVRSAPHRGAPPSPSSQANQPSRPNSLPSSPVIHSQRTAPKPKAPQMPSPHPSAANQGPLKVVRGSTYLNRQYLEKLKKKTRIRRVARTLVLGLLAVFLYGVIWDHGFIAACALSVMMLIGSIGILPYNAASRELQNYEKGLQGERIALKTLTAVLDGRWTLFTNVDLPDRRGDIDGVLIGPSGLYVLEIKAFSGAYRNRGLEWEYRNRLGRWRKASKNPSRQARANAKRLYDFLKQTADLDQWVAPRVFWTGNFIELEKPAVPIWLPDKPEWIRQDLRKGRPVGAEQLRLLRSILKTYTAGYRHSGS